MLASTFLAPTNNIPHIMGAYLGIWHFDFGWLEGPRCAAGDEVWVLDAGPVGPSPWSVRGVVTQVWVVQGGGDRSSRVAVDLGGGYSRVVSGRDVRLV